MSFSCFATPTRSITHWWCAWWSPVHIVLLVPLASPALQNTGCGVGYQQQGTGTKLGNFMEIIIGCKTQFVQTTAPAPGRLQTERHCEPMLTTVSPCSPLQAHAHHCEPMLTTASPRSPLQAHAHHCSAAMGIRAVQCAQTLAWTQNSHPISNLEYSTQTYIRGCQALNT